MRDDVIEFAQISRQRGKIAMHDADIGQSQMTNEIGPRLCLHARQFHAHAFGPRPTPRQGDQVAAGGASKLENACLRRIGRVEAMQLRNRSEEIRLGFRQGQAVVGQFVVTGERIHGDDCPSPAQAAQVRSMPARTGLG